MTELLVRRDGDTGIDGIASIRDEPSAAFRPYDLLCFSHLRWNFVFQRPQHLLTRFSEERRVFYVEEPIFEDVASPSMRIERKRASLSVVTPVLPIGMPASWHDAALRLLVDALIADEDIEHFGTLYYTPMALPFTQHLQPMFVAYDCMDELSSFKGAPAPMRINELQLLKRADVVFTGGWSLYDAKRMQHSNVHALPSSIDAAHFRRARLGAADRGIADLDKLHLGFFGVIDERFDGALVAGVAALRPNWDITLVGPIVKIDPECLPKADRVRYPGMAAYEDLPQWLAGWDVAIMPFARNESTRFISPTKTPEYLAGGKPVVSTSIHDVVHPYATLGLVHIADTPEAFVASCELSMRDSDTAWLGRVDEFLRSTSWDRTWQRMASLVEAAIHARDVRGALSSHSGGRQAVTIS